MSWDSGPQALKRLLLELWIFLYCSAYTPLSAIFAKYLEFCDMAWRNWCGKLLFGQFYAKKKLASCCKKADSEYVQSALDVAMVGSISG